MEIPRLFPAGNTDIFCSKFALSIVIWIDTESRACLDALMNYDLIPFINAGSQVVFQGLTDLVRLLLA